MFYFVWSPRNIFKNESLWILKCVNDSAAKVARLIVFSIMIFSGRSVDDVYVIRMAALCWRLGHLCGSVSPLPSLFLLAPLADEACHSLPRTGCARTRRCYEFPPPPVSQTPSRKGKNNNKHFSAMCAMMYTRKGAHKLTRCWQLHSLLCLSPCENRTEMENCILFSEVTEGPQRASRQSFFMMFVLCWAWGSFIPDQMDTERWFSHGNKLEAQKWWIRWTVQTGPWQLHNGGWVDLSVSSKHVDQC